MARKTLKARKSLGKVRKPRKRGGLTRWLWRLLQLAFLLGLLGLLGLMGMFWYYGQDLPEVSTLHHYEPPQTTRVVDRNGQTLGEIFSERRTVIPMARVPRNFVLSVLAAEDADFYQHKGLDYPGIARAVVFDIIQGRKAQGASTITQQVVKLMLLTPERTIRRKVRELILARRLENELSKDEILHLYINHINFGHARYGVQEAARYYFGKDAEELSLAESSLIAGVPQAPARLSPRSHPEAAARRQSFVLRQLEAKREERWPDLLASEIEEARDTNVLLTDRSARHQNAPEVMTIARRRLREEVGEEAFQRGGFTVHTTLDLELQNAAREAVQSGLRALDDRQNFQVPITRARRAPTIDDVDRLRVGGTYDAVVVGTSNTDATISLDVGGHEAIVDLRSLARHNPNGLSARDAAFNGAKVRASILRVDGDGEKAEAQIELGPQGAALVIDPRTRDILAMIGGYARTSGFNRVTQAVRQPGSTFKPLVYGVGIRTREFTPATLVIDAPAVYDEWNPNNYETWRHRGPIRIREALANSVNLVAIRVMDDVGPEHVVTFAHQLGIESELEATLSLALGSSGVRPIEMVNAYATFAAGGRWAAPRLITRIEGPDGDVELPAPDPPRDVMTPAEAFMITSLLRSVVRSGTARRAGRALGGRPAAGKTGTSNDARDAWFVGYTPNVVAGVWVGFDDRRPLGRRESGGRSALPIWIDMVKAAVGESPIVDFPVPSGVVTARIDPESGLLAYEGLEGAIEEYFLDGTEPTEQARPPDVADPTTFLMEQFGSAAPP